MKKSTFTKYIHTLWEKRLSKTKTNERKKMHIALMTMKECKKMAAS